MLIASFSSFYTVGLTNAGSCNPRSFPSYLKNLNAIEIGHFWLHFLYSSRCYAHCFTILVRTLTPPRLRLGTLRFTKETLSTGLFYRVEYHKAGSSSGGDQRQWPAVRHTLDCLIFHSASFHWSRLFLCTMRDSGSVESSLPVPALRPQKKSCATRKLCKIKFGRFI